MDEKKFLEKIAKSLKVEDLFEELEDQKLKEEMARVKISQATRKAVQPLVNLVENKIAPMKVKLFEDSLHEAPTNVVGKLPEPELPKNVVVNKYVQAMSKVADKINPAGEAPADDTPPGVRRELDVIKKAIADFHRFAQRHSQLGGGGAGDILNLDHPAKTLYSDYTVGIKDYYLGVASAAGPITITLPASAKNGRTIVVKDENSLASVNNITVVGLVDNDPGGFILAMDNGCVQIFYNNGQWRII